VRSPAACFVAVFFLFVCSKGLGAQATLKEGWYSSDPAGLVLESIPDPAGQEYALRIRNQDGKLRSELFRNGEEVKAWVRTYSLNGILSREAMEQDGLLKEEFLYDVQGRLSLERIFLGSGDIEETVYEYAEGRLVSRTTMRGETNLSKLTYLYAPDGRLALAKEESGSASGTSAARSGGSSSWRIGEAGLELRTYNADGRLVAISVYEGADRLSYEERYWQGGLLELVVVEAGNGSTTSTEYVLSGSATGEIAKITIKNGEKIVSTELRSYDEKSRLASLTTSLRGRESVVSYEYDDDDALVVTKTLTGGVLVSVVRHEAPAVRVEELYDAGVVVARVRYEDGRRVLEEMLRDGVVIRTRRFP